MTRLEGQRQIPKPMAEVFAKLADARFLVPCIPDVHEVKALQERHAELQLRPGFAFVRGTLEVKMEIVEVEAPRTVRVRLLSKGIGSSSEVEATLELSGAEGGTCVRWTAEVKSLGGLLKLVPGGLIQGAAQKVITDAWDRIEKALA